VYLILIRRLREALAAHIREKYGIDIAVVLEKPPKLELGEAASPVCFELAKRLKKAPRTIAQEIAASLPKIDGIARVEIAGGGYLNAYFDRAAFWKEATGRHMAARESGANVPRRVIVEHTSINPNKAAHIGHLRNAVLGDTMVRLLRDTGHDVAVQNYIDNTGVQVADVVIAFQLMERKSLADVRKLAAEPHFDYLCWDLYAKATQFFEEDKTRATKIRGETLKAIEEGKGETAEIAAVIAEAIVTYHLRTMARLDIYYELLARESEILHLHFWDAAFEKLKASGAIQLATTGKNAGCWIMPWGMDAKEAKNPAERAGDASLEDSASPTEEQAKIIVRSNGTVTYVGKDIAYHLWKFGLLGRDFGYREFFRYPNGHECWISAEDGEADHPHFGGVEAIYNVIDSRQSDPQNTVVEAIRLLGYPDKASHYTHFSYEMVALTPSCAMELGYEVSEEDRAKPYIEVSGRKGFGVKADDLLDALVAAAKKEVDSRHPELSDAERLQISEQIAIGALRYFMLKFTKQSVIAFDFKEALAFEGETGPYAQYAVVRASNIFRKAGVEPELTLRAEIDYSRCFADASGTEIWELWLLAGKTSAVIEQCIATSEPAYAAKHAFQLAQQFNNFYHRHHILNETDEERKKFLLATAAVVRRELIALLAVMGIQCPPVM